MELRPPEIDVFRTYLAPFTALTGDQRTARLLSETVRGIIASESLCCSQIAAFPPALAATPHAEQRIPRMVHGETTTRSPLLDADHLLSRLRERGVAQLCNERAIWVILDGSDLRKPHAREMEGLQRVKRLAGGGMVPGYRTLNAIGIGLQGRGLLYHHLFSSTADDFISESAETQAALTAVGAALAPLDAAVTDILDAGFDDIAVWDTGYPLGGMGAGGTRRLSGAGSHAPGASHRRGSRVSFAGMRAGPTATGTGGNGTGRVQGGAAA